MEYYPDTPTSQTYAQFSGATLVLPCLTIGNVGQLALDLLISTFEIPRVGFLDHPYVLPMVGNDAFTPNGSGVLTTSLELFFDKPHDLALIQQRAPVVKGRSKDFAESVRKWAISQGFARVILLYSADASYRRDYQMGARQRRYFGAIPPRSSHSQESLELERETFDITLRPGSLSRTLFDGFEAASLPVTGLAVFCNEGDNIPDAIDMADWLTDILKLLAIPTYEGQQKGGPVEWKFPNSWRLIQGDAFQPSLYQ